MLISTETLSGPKVLVKSDHGTWLCDDPDTAILRVADLLEVPIELAEHKKSSIPTTENKVKVSTSDCGNCALRFVCMSTFNTMACRGARSQLKTEEYICSIDIARCDHSAASSGIHLSCVYTGECPHKQPTCVLR